MAFETDARKATEGVREYCEKNYGNLAFISFLIHSVKPNTAENRWIVEFSFKPKMNEKRIYNRIKIDISNGDVIHVEEIER